MGASTAEQRRRWRRYLAEERMEATIYFALARTANPAEAEILRGLAQAERRHEDHWLTLLGDDAYPPPAPPIRSRLLGGLARVFGSVFVLALMQRSEQRSAYDADVDASDAMAADEHLHSEVVRALAAQSRSRLSGTFRAAVFGANDGLVSNLALVAGVCGAAMSSKIVIFTGLTGLLAGALSMAAGEYVSVRSQRELLESIHPDPSAHTHLIDLDLQVNELTLLFRARGLAPDEAVNRAEALLAQIGAERAHALAARSQPDGELGAELYARTSDFTEVGRAWNAAAYSFLFFAVGALIPVLPFIFGLSGITATVVAVGVVGLTLLLTGAIVGILSGSSPAWRALRQLLIGLGAAGATYALGALSGTVLG